jgi:hypothetical protein
MTTFRDYRNSVSILQIAEHLGYKPVKGKSTNARPVLRDAAGDTIIIKNPTTPSTQLYWNLNNNSEHGSVIDFVKNNISRFALTGRNETDSLNVILSNFAGVAYDNSKYMNVHLVVQKSFNENDYNVTVPDLSHLRYLTEERKLSADTLQTFLPFIRIVNNNGYKNIGFPFIIADKDNIVRGYEMRNYGGFKSFSAGGDKVNAAWIASFADNKDAVRNIFFFESAIDAMSFYELKKNYSFDMTNSVFVSTGGFPCTEQLAHVINGYPCTVKLFACHDNDLAGHMFDILLACAASQQTCIKNKLHDSVEFVTKGKRFTLANNRVSLNSFLKHADFQSNVKALKPNCKDWNEALQNKGVVSEVKKPVFTKKI